MSRTYITVSGDYVHTLPETRRIYAADFISDDCFLISQPVLSNLDPDRTYVCGDKVYHNEYASRHIKYSDLSAQVFADMSANFGIKSMAWELSDGYSLNNHVHGYSRLSVVPSIKPT